MAVSCSSGAPSARSPSGASASRRSTSSSVASRASSCARRRRRERGRAGDDTARLERSTGALRARPTRTEVGCVRHEPGQDQDARRVSHERLGHREQRVDARLVRDGDENRPLRGLLDERVPAVDIQRRVLPQDRPLQLLERRARLDPELVDEGPARVLVGVQSLGLPTRPVQRRHQTTSAGARGAGARRRAPRALRRARRGARVRGRRRSGAPPLPA